MDQFEHLLAILGSIAGVLGVLVSYLQYRAGRERAHARPWVPPVPVPESAQATTVMRVVAPAPPAAVRLACSWVILDALVAIGVWFLLFFTIVENRDGFGFPVPPVPDSVWLLAPLALAALFGAVKVPGAIHRGGGLRRGEAAMRAKLLGSAAVDLFVGAALVVLVLALDGTPVPVPEEVFGALTLYIGYRIVSGLVDIALLTHRSTRTWVESGGRSG